MSPLAERLRTNLAGRYAVEHQVGRGGMATVFLAQDLKHNRRVAIKVLHPELAVTLGTERFLREIQITVQALGSSRVVTPHATPLATPALIPKKSVAVLPFADMSPAKDQDYSCEGIADEIINALSRVEAIHVASRTSAFAFKGKSEDIGEIGRKLKVTTVLEGSVRKAGNRLRVTAQLVNVQDGYQLWSERFDRDLEDVFAIQDEIAGSIVKALRVVLTEAEKRAIEKPEAVNVEAYDYYLRGRQYFHQFRRTGMQFARRMFERAMEIDPNYAPALAGAADCCSFLYMYWDASRANLEGAESYSRRALEVAPDSAEAHAARGLALGLSKRYGEAEQEFVAAHKLNPKLYEAHYFHGRALFQQGKHEGAITRFQEAGRVRPEDYQAPMLLSLAHEAMGRREEAGDALRSALQIAEKHLELNPDDARALYFGAQALIQVGDRAKALEWADRALALDPNDSGVLYNVACAYSLAGLVDEAFGCLDMAVQNGFGHREWLENDSDLNNLRADPRFEPLLRKF